MRQLIIILALVIGLCTAGNRVSPAWGQDEDKTGKLKRLFDEIREAEKRAQYQAEQTVYDYSPQRVSSTRFRVQYAYPFRKRETVDVPDERRCIMLEDGKDSWSYFPGRRIVVREPLSSVSSPLPPPEAVARLSQNYQVYVRGPVQARGRSYQILEFVPYSKDRPQREIWLEEKRKVPVRVYISQPDGRSTYRSELEIVRWDQSFDPETFRLRVPPDTRVYEIQKRERLSLERAKELLNRPVHLPLTVPAGFAPINMILRTEAERKHLQVVYTDGLSSFSVFLEWGEPRSTEKGRASDITFSETSRTATAQSASVPRIPETYHFGIFNVVTLVRGGQKTVCVGDVLEDQLHKVAHSLQETSPFASPPDRPTGQQNTLDR